MTQSKGSLKETKQCKKDSLTAEDFAEVFDNEVFLFYRVLPRMLNSKCGILNFRFCSLNKDVFAHLLVTTYHRRKHAFFNKAM